MSSVLDIIRKNGQLQPSGGEGQEDGKLLRDRVILGETALTEFLQRAGHTKGGEFLYNWSNWAKDRI